MAAKNTTSSSVRQMVVSDGAPIKVVLAPTAQAPSAPVGWAPGGRPKRNATEQQVRDASDVARELTETKRYVADFTNRAPSAADLAARLLVAQAWSNEAAAAEAWRLYANDQRDRAWDLAFVLVKKFQKEFVAADEHDLSVAERYPQTKAFLGVRSKAAQKGAATRAKKKKAKAGDPAKP
jgi:hypothetical protein